MKQLDEMEEVDLLECLSPELRQFVEQKLDSLDDDQLQRLCNTFMPFPSSSRESKNPEDDDWFVLPTNLAHLPHSKPPISEGLRMFAWQEIVLAELEFRGLGKAKFWSREQITTYRHTYLTLVLKHHENAGSPKKARKSKFYTHSRVKEARPREIPMDPSKMDSVYYCKE